MLSSYRVLDLSGQQGIFCGYLLAHLGAEVVVNETSAEMLDSHGTGLMHAAYNRGKTIISLDLDSNEGREQFRNLVSEADFLIESFSRQQVSDYGMNYAVLAELNPRLILVSITPFGRSGPKADWPATDLTVWASSGAHILSGDSDRAPTRPSVPQAFLHAGADAAGAALIALQERHQSGRGQHVDISAQQSAAQAALTANIVEQNNGGITITRMAGGAILRFPIQLTWPCRDGYVAITLMFGMSFDGPNRRLLEWVMELGACSQEDVDTDWGTRVMAMFQGEESTDDYFELCKKVGRFTAQLTQQELLDGGQQRGLYIAPVLDIPGLLAEKQFRQRNFWHRLPGTSTLMPGAFARLPASPLHLPGAAAVSPTASTHVWSQSTSPTGPADKSKMTSTLPLAGLKVLDFMWVAAGPYFTRVLSDYGATVIKVESTVRLDAARGLPAFKDGEVTVDSSTAFNSVNAGKMGITLDPANPVGREVILDLVRWADVVTESFSPRAMTGWDLDYNALAAIKPDLIMLSSCLMGQTGPRAQLPGYGNMAAAIAGFYNLTGWPDRSPAGPYGAYTDTVAPRFALVSLLGAIEHRRKTGEGQHIDLSQSEAAIHFLAPAILEFQQGGQPARMGNRDYDLSPHGVFPAKGTDSWVAIACQDDMAWANLRDLMGLPDDQDLSTAPGRQVREEELDDLISAYTRKRSAPELQSLLTDAGVAAHMLQNSPECMNDPQLIDRQHFINVAHASLGDFVVENSRSILSRTPAQISRAGPELGEHNFHVLSEILGYSESRIADVYASLAIQ